MKQQQQKRKLKVLIGQTSPSYKQIDKNIDRIYKSLQGYSKKDKIDIIMFPEMTLTGQQKYQKTIKFSYLFKDKDDIEPFLEQQGNGATFEFCKNIALRLDCYVLCGYPEIDGDKYYNSAQFINRRGELIMNHRKKHLFEADKTWASEGQSFSSITIQNTQNQDIVVAIAICMDINCYEFIDNSQFELAMYCKQQNIDALLFISAWNDHEPENLNDSACDGIMNYWLWRLQPLVNKKDKQTDELYQKSWIFYCADRVGTEQNLIKEGKTDFIGCSCVIKVNPLELVNFLKKQVEGYIISEVIL